MKPADERAGRLARFLARRLREAGEEAEAPVSVAELHRVLLPYPACRDALGFATKAEYDLAVLHLLRRGETVRVREEALAEAVEKELGSPEPGLAFLRNFAASPLELRVDPEGEGRSTGSVAEADGDGGPEAGPEAEGDAGGEAGPEEPAGERAPSAGEWLEDLDAAVGDGRARACATCGEELPPRPGVRYCPHCGADLSVRLCGECGERLEEAWRFCPRCGTAGGGGG